LKLTKTSLTLGFRSLTFIRWADGTFLDPVVSGADMRWTLPVLLLIGANACVRTAEQSASSSMPTVSRGDSKISKPAVDTGTLPPAARNGQLPLEHSKPPVARSWLVNSGACLEPLEPVYQLTDSWTDVRRGLNLDDDALVVLVTAPAFRQPHAVSLHRRPAGAYFLKVTRLGPGELRTRIRERTLDPKTAKLLLKLWKALASRVQLIESDEVSFDGKAYFFSTGRVTAYAANPRRGSVLGRAIFAVDWLTDLVEEPASEDPSDWKVIQEEIREALARTVAMEPCVRRVVE
jgi:hypothetical protein